MSEPRTRTKYGYDSPGNLNSGSGVSGISYNAENQLVTAAGVTYNYDGDGRRVAKSVSGSVNKIYWFGASSDALDETDGAGNTNNSGFNEYVFFGSQRIARRDSSNNAFYYFTDHLGTSRTIAEVASGQNTATLCYDVDFYPFGGERAAIVNTCSQNYKFTGKERDSESGLDNFIKRYDSSSLGRFMSPDPQNAGAESEDPQSWNAYAYARNNPLTYTDPDGEKYQICDTSNHCTEISDEDFNNNFQNAKNVQLNGNQISIQDANGNFNKEGTFKRTSFDDLDANGNAFFNEMSARREPSLHAIEVFAVRSVTDSVGGAVLGKAIGAGVEAIQGARAASAAAAETTDLITQAASTVGNRGAVASSEAVATQAGEEWVGIGARPIYSRSGEVVGKISADGQRVYRITSIDKAQPYVNLENKATGGNLHVRF